MAGMVTQLLEMLDKQAQSFEELYGLSEEKRDAIVKNDIDALQKITNLENILITQNHRIEKKRLTLVKDIAGVLDKKDDNLTLAGLIEALEGQAEQEDLKAVGRRIQAALGKLSEANALNESLIKNALEYIEYSVNVIQSALNQEVSMYSVQGGRLREESGTFDAKK